MKRAASARRPFDGTFSWPPDAHAAIAAVAVPAAYPPGTVLMQQRAQVRDAHLIEEGVVQLALEGYAGGDRLVIGYRSTGWLVGGSFALIEGAAPMTATTVTACRVLTASAQTLRELMASNRDVMWQVSVMTAEEVCAFEQIAPGVDALPLRKRVEYLLNALARSGSCESPAGPVRITELVTDEKLADAIMTSASDVHRILAELEQEGLFRRERGAIVLLDPARLWHGDDVAQP
jgi:CRP-like cAMP-binding protein